MVRSRWNVVLAGLVVVAGLTGAIGAQGTGTPAQSKPAEDEFLKGTYNKTTPGITMPVTMREVKPKYTSDAMRAKLQGGVKLQLVVAQDGTVSRVRVLESLDAATGLDDAAVAAARQWMFSPGKLDGKAVPVAVEVYLEFRLHISRQPNRK